MMTIEDLLCYLNNDYLEERFGYDKQKGEREFNELFYPYKNK